MHIIPESCHGKAEFSAVIILVFSHVILQIFKYSHYYQCLQQLYCLIFIYM